MRYGYPDGRKPDSPQPLGNRSHSYRHGFANGRDNLAKHPRATDAVPVIARSSSLRTLMFGILRIWLRE